MTEKTIFEKRNIEEKLLRKDKEFMSKSAKEVFNEYGPVIYRKWEQMKNEDMTSNNIEKEEEEGEEINQTLYLSELEIEASKEKFGSMPSRFGKKLGATKGGSIPFALYKHQGDLGLSINEVWFLVWVILHKWDYTHSFISLRAMARYTGKSRQHISTIANGLADKGYIEIIGRKNKNKATISNLYNIYPLIELLLEALENKAKKVKENRSYT